MSTQIEDLEEEVEVSEALRARFAFATGNVKPISDEQLGKSRVKRTLGQQRKQELVNGPAGAPLPIGSGVVAKYRSPRAFMDEALKYLHPEEVGPAFAKMFLSALEKQDVGLLKIMLPYVFGAPSKQEEGNQVSGAIFGELLSVLKEPPIANPSGKRGKQPEIFVVGESYQLPEEPEDEAD